MIPIPVIIVGVGLLAAWVLLLTQADRTSTDDSTDSTVGADIGGLLMSGFTPFSSLKDYTGCGIYGIDRLPLAELVEEQFGTDATVAHARSMVAICYCETSGKTTPPVVGDTSLTVGPAIGPLQVTRGTAKDLGLIPKDESFDTYKQRAMDEEWCLRAGVKVFASKLLSAKGDFADAIRRYNGSGDKAIQYRDKALSFLADKFGSNWQSA